MFLKHMDRDMLAQDLGLKSLQLRLKILTKRDEWRLRSRLYQADLQRIAAGIPVGESDDEDEDWDEEMEDGHGSFPPQNFPPPPKEDGGEGGRRRSLLEHSEVAGPIIVFRNPLNDGREYQHVDLKRMVVMEEEDGDEARRTDEARRMEEARRREEEEAVLRGLETRVVGPLTPPGEEEVEAGDETEMPKEPEGKGAEKEPRRIMPTLVQPWDEDQQMEDAPMGEEPTEKQPEDNVPAGPRRAFLTTIPLPSDQNSPVEAELTEKQTGEDTPAGPRRAVLTTLPPPSHDTVVEGALESEADVELEAGPVKEHRSSLAHGRYRWLPLKGRKIHSLFYDDSVQPGEVIPEERDDEGSFVIGNYPDSLSSEHHLTSNSR